MNKCKSLATPSAAVTGHRALGDKASSDWVKRMLMSVVKEKRVSRGITCLAEGADQIYASVLGSLGIPYDAIIPCDHYDAVFADPISRSTYEKLLQHAFKVELLDFPNPSPEAFYAAGARAVDEADFLIAVWDGKMSRQKGGTADIVAYARMIKKSIVRLDPKLQIRTEM